LAGTGKVGVAFTPAVAVAKGTGSLSRVGNAVGPGLPQAANKIKGNSH
jgi:hypothetical protein